MYSRCSSECYDRSDSAYESGDCDDECDGDSNHDIINKEDGAIIDEQLNIIIRRAPTNFESRSRLVPSPGFRTQFQSQDYRNTQAGSTPVTGRVVYGNNTNNLNGEGSRDDDRSENRSQCSSRHVVYKPFSIENDRVMRKREEKPKGRMTEDSETLFKQHVPLVLTNHVINDMQKKIFGANSTFEAVYILFITISRCTTNVKNKLFTVYDKEDNAWIPYDISNLSYYLSTYIAEFVISHIKKLMEYEDLLLSRELRYSEVITTRFYDFKKYSKDSNVLWTKMETFGLWNKIEEWEKSVIDSNNYVIEDTSDPCVVSKLVSTSKFPKDNKKYIESRNKYKVKNEELTCRLEMNNFAWYKTKSLPVIQSNETLIGQVIYQELLIRIGNEITIWKDFHRILCQKKSQGHEKLLAHINTKKDIVRQNMENKHFIIGVDNNLSHNLQTLTKHQRCSDDNIRTFCKQNVKYAADTTNFNRLLTQMAGCNNTNLCMLKDVIGASILADPLYPRIIMLGGDFNSRKILSGLYINTYGDIAEVIEPTVLENNVDMKLSCSFRDRRIIIVKNVASDIIIKPSVLMDYFDRSSMRNIDGNCHYNNSVLILEGDSFPVIDSPQYKDNVWYLDLHKVDNDHYFNYNQNEYSAAFFYRSIRFAKDVHKRNNIPNITLPLPLSLTQSSLSSSGLIATTQQFQSVSLSTTQLQTISLPLSLSFNSTTPVGNNDVYRRTNIRPITSTPSERRRGRSKKLVVPTMSPSPISHIGTVNPEWPKNKIFIANFLLRRVDFENVDPLYQEEFPVIFANFSKFADDEQYYKRNRDASLISEKSLGRFISNIKDEWGLQHEKGDKSSGNNRGCATHYGVKSYDHDIINM